MSVAKVKLADGTWVPIAVGGRGPQGIQGEQGLPGVSGLTPFSVGGLIAPQAFDMPLYADWETTIQSVRASVGQAPTGAPIVVDVLKNGTTIFPGGVGRPSITAGTKTALATLATPVLLVPGDYLTVTIVSVGSTFAGSGLVVQWVTY